MSATETLDPQQAEVHRLIEEQAALEELQQHPGWAVLSALAQQSFDAHQAKMNSGRLDTLEEYKFLAGWLDGARGVFQIPQRAAERLERAKTPNEMWQDVNPELDETRS